MRLIGLSKRFARLCPKVLHFIDNQKNFAASLQPCMNCAGWRRCRERFREGFLRSVATIHARLHPEAHPRAGFDSLPTRLRQWFACRCP